MTNRAKLMGGTVLATLAVAGAPAMAQTTGKRKPPTVTLVATPTTKPITPVYRNVRGFYRNVRGFWGDVNPFYRNVRGFWGDVDPFYRNVRGFWGTMDPSKMATAASAPGYAGLGPFWEGLGGQWEGIASHWQTAGAYSTTNANTYSAIAQSMNTMISTSESYWGAAVTKKTGKSFADGFANAVLARHGINLADPASLANLPANEQSHFFMDWYDGLMTFSGVDAPDHWMKTVNWTPRLTQIQGGGSQAVIGLIDQFSAADADVRGKLLYSGGTGFQPAEMDGAIHGAGVLSLINASHDGKGVMGIAPNAKVFAYNPFDANGGADWGKVGTTSIIEGIKQVGTERTIAGQKMRATVINLSLGEAGTTFSTKWRDVFKTSEVDSFKDHVVYVIAAGNDSHRQVNNIEMNGALDSTFIVVGSVDPTGKISEFSNTPGNACLTDGGQCKTTGLLKDSGALKNRFIVAPGELILVSDGKGGTTRQSGTSLAAPLVAGAIALIQDRWPWIKQKPRDIAQMILGSAKDLGAPGIDDVYGVGLLDVEAAQSPLNFDAMKYYLYSSTGAKGAEVRASTLEDKGLQATWASKNMYFTAFEKLIDEERDFLIPLSSTLYGGTNRNGEYFQDYVYNRMTTWIAAPGFAGQTRLGFSDTANTGGMERANGWSMGFRGRMVWGYADQAGRRQQLLNTTVDLTGPDGRFALSFGRGDGALAVGGSAKLGMSSDFDPYTGGANPLLGFASGGSHAAVRMQIAPGIDVKAGVTEQTRSLGLDTYNASAADRLTLAGMDRYKATATNIGVDMRPTSWLSLSASATRLAEPNAFLGTRTTANNAFGDGTVSTGVTVDADASIGWGLSLFGSATSARTSSANDGAALRVRNATGTAFQGGIAKRGLLGKGDSLRLSLAQPLATEGGTIETTQMQVIDRQTGEKGWVTERFDIEGGKRRLVAEALYGTSVMGGKAELGLFGRSELSPMDATTPQLMIGSQFRLSL